MFLPRAVPPFWALRKALSACRAFLHTTSPATRVAMPSAAVLVCCMPTCILASVSPGTEPFCADLHRAAAHSGSHAAPVHCPPAESAAAAPHQPNVPRWLQIVSSHLGAL